MTDTLERTDTTTDTDVDSLPDFTPACSIMTSFPGRKPKPCEEPAKWQARTPCCGVVGLICDHHRHNHGPFRCSCGRHHADLIGWAPL